MSSLTKVLVDMLPESMASVLFCHTFRYPDATPEDLQASDNVCIICREEMVTGAKKLPCNHIFHSRYVAVVNLILNK